MYKEFAWSRVLNTKCVYNLEQDQLSSDQRKSVLILWNICIAHIYSSNEGPVTLFWDNINKGAKLTFHHIDYVPKFGKLVH